MKKGLLLIIPLLLSGCLEYSDGDRVGVVTKISKKGLFCKTWEGTMNLGGMRKESQVSSDGKSIMDVMVPNTFNFTIENEELLPSIHAALESGNRIKVTYTQELITFCRSDSGYFVTNVK